MPSLIRPKASDAQAHLQSLFLRTEKKLVDEIARKLNAGYVDYAERAALKRVQETLRTMEDECFTYVPRMVQEKFIKSNKDLYGYSNAEAVAGLSAPQLTAIERLVDNLLGQIDEAAAQTFKSTQELLTLGRLENDPFRAAGLSAAAQAEALGAGSLTQVTSLVTELETKGLTAFVDKAGRHWSLRDYGNMAVRTTARQAEVAAVLTADDWDLWQIVKIGSTCPLCAVYEGRVYSKSGKDPNYPPLAMAFGKIDPAGGNDLSNTYLNIHPNCLHSLIKFTEMGKSEKQLQKIQEFSSPITNPMNVDRRTKAQKEAYEKKTANRARLLREMREKQARSLERGNLMRQESPKARPPKNYENNFDDFKPLSLSPKETDVLSGLRKQANSTGHEYGMILNSDGTTVPKTSNHPNHVEIPDSEITRPGTKLYHSHTGNTPPSAQDLRRLTNPNVDEVGTTSYNNDVFTVSVGDGWRPSKDEFDEVEEEIRKAVDSEMKRRFFDEGWTPDELNYMCIREELYRLGLNFGWDIRGGRI